MQHASQGTGGYGHTVEGDPGGQRAGRRMQVGGRSPGGQVEREFQSGQSPTGGQGTAGERIQVTGGQGAQMAPQQGPGVTLDDALTGPMRVALHDTSTAGRVCEWCADQCIDEGPGMARCIRLCRDVADLARLNAAFVVRDSMFGPDVARTFAEAAEECALECQRHPEEHCQECARVLRRAARTARELVAAGGGREVAGRLPAGGQ